MRLFPSSISRPVLLLAIGGGLIFARLKQTWWRYPEQIYDEAAILDREQRFQADAILAEVTRSTGVDIRILTTNSLAGAPIEMYALRRMRELEVGSTTDRHGILVVLDMGGKQVRVEIGPKLEGIMTDSYAGFVARDVLTPMLVAGGEPIRIILGITNVLRFRINEGLLGQEWDPALVTEIRERHRLALGGGADAVARLSDLARMAHQAAPPEARARYVAQPTAAAALARYLEWVQEPFSYHDVDFLTEGTREILTTINHDTPLGVWRFDQLALSRERYVLVERGWRAIAVPTVSPLTHPVWLVRGKNGWRYELTPEFTIVRNLVVSPWTWLIHTQQDGWVREFGDLLEKMPYDEYDLYRFRMGNNTPVPGRGSYR